jgi:hypothetical protein
MKIANCVDIWIIVILTDFLTNNQRPPIKNCAMRIFGVKPLNAMAVNVLMWWQPLGDSTLWVRAPCME